MQQWAQLTNLVNSAPSWHKWTNLETILQFHLCQDCLDTNEITKWFPDWPTCDRMVPNPQKIGGSSCCLGHGCFPTNISKKCFLFISPTLICWKPSAISTLKQWTGCKLLHWTWFCGSIQLRSYLAGRLSLQTTITAIILFSWTWFNSNSKINNCKQWGVGLHQSQNKKLKLWLVWHQTFF